MGLYRYDGTSMNLLNFGWVIDGKPTGYKAASSEQDLASIVTWLDSCHLLILP